MDQNAKIAIIEPPATATIQVVFEGLLLFCLPKVNPKDGKYAYCDIGILTEAPGHIFAADGNPYSHRVLRERHGSLKLCVIGADGKEKASEVTRDNSFDQVLDLQKEPFYPNKQIETASYLSIRALAGTVKSGPLVSSDYDYFRVSESVLAGFNSNGNPPGNWATLQPFDKLKIAPFAQSVVLEVPLAAGEKLVLKSITKNEQLKAWDEQTHNATITNLDGNRTAPHENCKAFLYHSKAVRASDPDFGLARIARAGGGFALTDPGCCLPGQGSETFELPPVPPTNLG